MGIENSMVKVRTGGFANDSACKPTTTQYRPITPVPVPPAPKK